MLAPKYFLYIAYHENGETQNGLSPDPRDDAPWLRKAGFTMMQVFRPPLPIFLAELAVERLRRSAPKPRQWPQAVAGIIQTIQPQKTLPPETFQLNEFATETGGDELLLPALAGRIVLGKELSQLYETAGLSAPWDPERSIQPLIRQGLVQRQAAVTMDRLGLPVCRRCGATAGIIEDHCLFCGNPHCLTCTQCQSMGVAKSCQPLYSRPDRATGITLEPAISPKLHFELTPPQQRAATELRKFWTSDQEQFLVWAVCGGGKTEVSFGIVADVLNSGGRVLFAIPRKDIVQELYPRFREAFPEITIAAIFGGSGERFSDARLIIATTHQCLRFYQAFDLVIIDEEDAFPYQGSAMLHFAVQRGMKPGGKLVVMTATPDQSTRKKLRQGELPNVTIPARPHRQPLPIPEFIRGFLPKISARWEPPVVLQELLCRLPSNGRRLLIFLPKVSEVEEYGRQICRWAGLRGISGSFVHAGTAQREGAKGKLLSGEFLFLVVSTIYERGITIPDLDVAVLNADFEGIFDCPTLVQIAGRAGRNGKPSRVLLIGSRESRAVHEAIEWIRSQNAEGYRLGYLDRKIGS